jgi:hypothetical protein
MAGGNERGRIVEVTDRLSLRAAKFVQWNSGNANLIVRGELSMVCTRLFQKSAWLGPNQWLTVLGRGFPVRVRLGLS